MKPTHISSGVVARKNSAVMAVAGLAGLAASAQAQAAPADIETEGGDRAGRGISETVVVTGEKRLPSPKLMAPLRDTPKSITVIPQELIQETGSASLADVLRTVPGITFGAGEGGNPVGDRPFLRGYDAQSSTFVDGLRDIGAQSREVFNVESVEVIKGATGVYTGRGGPGGGVYINSKTPQDETMAAATIGLGTDEYKRATMDVNYAFGDGAALRFNAMAFDSGVAGRDEVHASRWGVAPTLGFGLGTRTRLILGYYHMESDDLPDAGIPYNNPTFRARTDGVPRILTPGDGSPIDVDRNTYYGLVNRDFRKENIDMATVRVEHDITSNLHIRNTTRYAETGQDYIWTQPDDSQGNIYYGYVWRRTNTRISDVSYLINQTDLYGAFRTGEIRHSFAAGVEFSREEAENDSYTVTSGGLALSAYNRCLASAITSYNCAPLHNPNPNDPWVGSIARTGNPTNARTTTKSVYFFDTIEFDEHWQVNLGVRYDHYAAEYISARAAGTNLRSEFKRTDDLVNYQGAIVYKPSEMSAVYLSYATASTPAGNALSQGSDPAALSSTINANLKPEENETIELGGKWDLLGGKLALTGAVFQVETTNARITQTDGTVAMAGEKRVRGFEVGFSGAVTEQWDIFGGYTYLDAILVKNGGAGAAAGLTDGQPFPNTPKHGFSLWTTYEVLPALKIGVGANYLSKVMGSTNPATPKYIPSYWRFDASATYEFNDDFSLQLNVQNLTDEVYFTQAYPTHYATIAPGRSAVLTLNAKF